MTTNVFTVGHSRHAADRLVALLRAHEIILVVDVRSQPVSRRAPQFDRPALTRVLGARGVGYVFLGRQLGGRPEGGQFYRPDGTVDYALRQRAPDFADGVEQLLALSRDRRAAILCAEEDPTRCHRRLLVAPALQRAGATVTHVRGDGRLELEPAAEAPRQIALFGDP